MRGRSSRVRRWKSWRARSSSKLRGGKLRWRNEIRLSDHSPSGHHRKGTGRERNRRHAGVRGCVEGDQDRSEGSGAEDLQSEGRFRAHRELHRQGTPPRKVLRLPSRLEEGLRKAEVRRKDAGVCAEFIELLAASY